ncbi:MAG: FAD-dependent oxidoreductase [Deltaproteobacteria bacterium]|nr:FAD-dependent oxidoreductase [Deltaproteobacteria bacterium]MBI3388491.1 FAD-dependent oxidoreductase [Deltaproteobacteria bacterium]
MKSVAIIGGGFAGLAAGVELAARGVPVTVLEARARLGGRAYSFRDDDSGEVVDNGQHALMGCYTHTLAFLDRIGALDKVVRQPNLRVEMIDARRGAGVIAATALPSPLHMLGGVLGYGLLSRAERLRALLGGMWLMAMRQRRDPRLAELTVEQLLIALGQSANARTSFWYPVAIATLNETPDRAAAAPFAEVLARAFFGSRSGSQFVLPRVGLSDLYVDDARRFIEARGGRVEVRAAIAKLRIEQGRVTAVRLRDGQEIEADAVISTVPPQALRLFAPGALRDIADFESSPIVSTHLWFDRAVMQRDFIGLLGTTTQFVFNRSKLTASGNGHRSGNDRQCVSAVISAGREVAAWESTRIADTVVADIGALLPGARAAQLLRSVVVKEKHATISITPDAERARPPMETAISNFLLAGDWTQTGLPPTIESAVLSGQRAAQWIAAHRQDAGATTARRP